MPVGASIRFVVSCSFVRQGVDAGSRKISYWFATRVAGRRWVYLDTAFQ
jgi:hypothetical protein